MIAKSPPFPIHPVDHPADQPRQRLQATVIDISTRYRFQPPRHGDKDGTVGAVCGEASKLLRRSQRLLNKSLLLLGLHASKSTHWSLPCRKESLGQIMALQKGHHP